MIKNSNLDMAILLKNIDMLKKKIEDNKREIMARGLEALRTEVIKEVPVDTGRLKNSLQGTVTQGDAVYEIKTPKNKVEGYLGTNVSYAAFVEFGTSRQSANPYFSRGLRSATPSIQAIFKKGFKGILDNARNK